MTERSGGERGGEGFDFDPADADDARLLELLGQREQQIEAEHRQTVEARISKGLARERRGALSFDHFVDDAVARLEHDYFVGEIRDVDRRELTRAARERLRAYEDANLRNPLEADSTNDYQHCLNSVVNYYLAHIHPIGLTVDDGRRKYGSEEAFAEVLRKWRDENIRP